MRLALGQPPSRPSLGENILAAAELVEQASNNNAHLLLLPELFLSGYRLDAIANTPQEWVVTVTDARLQPLVRSAERHGVAVAVGAALHDAATATIHNATLWIRTDGSVEHVYSKVHLWEEERAVFAPGNRQAIVRCHDLTLGIGICYDAGFPEFTRSYAQAGVDAVLFSSAFATGNEQYRYDIYHPSRALENGVYVAVSNSVGIIDGSEFFGQSRVFDRSGRCMLNTPLAQSLAVAELSTASTDEQLVPFLKDLRSITVKPDYFKG
ncbi:carbon-nitrogen hydrolase family protein [Mycolicibacterium mageritense]|uniref:Glutamine-dependent NAD(+) synthetase n=1 Tax=Mycolicibacterium mageritense TaxID=53462 RepID=A0AAI8TL34_MYCME|nr:carbon-nitrogen hydrolase family protein [Mycolicibacterium mageritense]BDY26703.1 Glutamine-dependent NAD(+) synthetase [Mycolicibacterium mageritense]